MKIKNTCEFSELLFHAERELKIPWNRAHEMLVDAGMYQGDIYVDGIIEFPDDYDLPKEVADIVISFAKKAWSYRVLHFTKKLVDIPVKYGIMVK